MNAYFFKNPSIPRSGSTPKIVTYSIPTGERTFDFHTPNMILTGSTVKKAPAPKAKEANLFRRMSLKDQPDSRRTLEPQLAPQSSERLLIRSKSVRNMQTHASINPGNSNSLIFLSDQEGIQVKKRSSTSCYERCNVSDRRISQSYRRLTRYNMLSSIRDSEYKKYDNTTQIYSLPGGVKRRQSEIDDDTRPPMKVINRNRSFATKLIRDYNSNISCLPGGRTDSTNDLQRKIGVKRYESNDIFNINQMNTPCNLFKMSYKKSGIASRIFEESDQEKRLISYPKAHRPGSIRDPFVSQIKIC